MENEKKRLRQLKREIKKAGNRNVRNYLKRELHDCPEEAHWSDVKYVRNCSQEMNGMFRHDS